MVLISTVSKAGVRNAALWGNTTPISWDAMSRELWPILHGSPYASSPKCDTLYNVLYSMGIYPNIETFPLRHVNRFADLDEAVDYFAPRCFS
ncbi:MULTISPECIES: hypothetical protein [unclassified Methanoculleus]|uniref:hypothetical protein n=1 Tax=unclassified Methanoculleus TaxID=2619537 RepID=UPI00316AC04B